MLHVVEIEILFHIVTVALYNIEIVLCTTSLVVNFFSIFARLWTSEVGDRPATRVRDFTDPTEITMSLLVMFQLEKTELGTA